MRKAFIVLIIFGLSIVFIQFYRVSRENHLIGKFRTEILSVAAAYHREVYETYLEKLGPEKILDNLEESYPLCHSEAHDLGRVIFERAKDFADSLEACRDRCSGGCFHGVLMEAFKGYRVERDEGDHISLDEFKNKINTLCDDPQVLAIHRKGKCVHGVGHAAAYVANYDLAKALSYCRVYKDKRLDFYCAGGVFMEYEGIRGWGDVATKSLHYPCDTFTEFPASCYPHKMRYLLTRVGNRQAAIQECLALDGFREIGCFQGLGYTYALDVERNPRFLAAICEYGPAEAQKGCLYGAIIKLSETDPEKALTACGYLEGERRVFCEETIEQGAYYLERSFDRYFNAEPLPTS